MAFIIIPEENKNVDTTKFNSCIFRSDKEIEYLVRKCCNSSLKKNGYVCSKLLINGLIPLNCLNCDLYKKKDS